jgi:hypothetical protein
MNKKARADSVLDGLPRNQRDRLTEWLFEENISYKDCAKRLYQDFNVTSSRSALERFYQREQQRRLLARIADSARKANEIADTFAKNPAPVPKAVVDLVTQLAFEEITERGSTGLDKDFIVKLTKLAVDSGLKAKKLELDQRRIELLEAKAAQATEAEKALTNTALSEEQQRAKLKEIFGITT